MVTVIFGCFYFWFISLVPPWMRGFVLFFSGFFLERLYVDAGGCWVSGWELPLFFVLCGCFQGETIIRSCDFFLKYFSCWNILK
jgi:hypothetical protein